MNTDCHGAVNLEQTFAVPTLRIWSEGTIEQYRMLALGMYFLFFAAILISIFSFLFPFDWTFASKPREGAAQDAEERDPSSLQAMPLATFHIWVWLDIFYVGVVSLRDSFAASW